MERNNKKRCEICNKEISKTNWSKHIKSRKHLSFISQTPLDNVESQENYNPNILLPQNTCKYCGNETITENQFSETEYLRNWNDHLKSVSHKNNTKLFRENLKKNINQSKLLTKEKDVLKISILKLMITLL
jgi:hypothetical protein